MNALRTLFLLALTATLPVATAGEQTVSKVSVFDKILYGNTTGGTGSPNQFASAFPMEMVFEGYAENLNPAPYTNNFIVELYGEAPEPLVRHVFALPQANDTGDRVVVPISFTYSMPTTVERVSARVFGDGPADRIHAWGKLTQTGTIIDAPIIKLPNLVVPLGTTEVQGVVTVSGGAQRIAGLEFPLQVANGGPENIPPADSIVPIAISAMETQFPGSVFSNRDVYQLHPTLGPRGTARSEIFPGEFQIGQNQTLINAGEPYVSIDGTDLPLLQFTLSLHDLPAGIYPLISSNMMWKASLLDDSRDNAVVESVQIMDGSIIVLPRPGALVPEPSTIVLAGIAGVSMVGLVARRRSQARR